MGPASPLFLLEGVHGPGSTMGAACGAPQHAACVHPSSYCRALGEEGAEQEVVLCDHKPTNLLIRRRDIKCMQAASWLNDEVINVWMGMLQVGLPWSYRVLG